MVPLESMGAVSYLPSIVTMALSCIVCKILRLIDRKSRNFYTLSVFRAPAGGLLGRNFAKTFNTHKTRMIGLPCDEETMVIC